MSATESHDHKDSGQKKIVVRNVKKFQACLRYDFSYLLSRFCYDQLNGGNKTVASDMVPKKTKYNKSLLHILQANPITTNHIKQYVYNSLGVMSKLHKNNTRNNMRIALFTSLTTRYDLNIIPQYSQTKTVVNDQILCYYDLINHYKHLIDPNMELITFLNQQIVYPAVSVLFSNHHPFCHRVTLLMVNRMKTEKLNLKYDLIPNQPPIMPNYTELISMPSIKRIKDIFRDLQNYYIFTTDSERQFIKISLEDYCIKLKSNIDLENVNNTSSKIVSQVQSNIVMEILKLKTIMDADQDILVDHADIMATTTEMDGLNKQDLAVLKKIECKSPRRIGEMKTGYIKALVPGRTSELESTVNDARFMVPSYAKPNFAIALELVTKYYKVLVELFKKEYDIKSNLSGLSKSITSEAKKIIQTFNEEDKANKSSLKKADNNQENRSEVMAKNTKLLSPICSDYLEFSTQLRQVLQPYKYDTKVMKIHTIIHKNVKKISDKCSGKDIFQYLVGVCTDFMEPDKIWKTKNKLTGDKYMMVSGYWDAYGLSVGDCSLQSSEAHCYECRQIEASVLIAMINKYNFCIESDYKPPRIQWDDVYQENNDNTASADVLNSSSSTRANSEDENNNYNDEQS